MNDDFCSMKLTVFSRASSAVFASILDFDDKKSCLYNRNESNSPCSEYETVNRKTTLQSTNIVFFQTFSTKIQIKCVML